MTKSDREADEKLRKLESIEAQLAQHNKAVRRGLKGLTAIGILLLALVGYAITRL